jgi:hypothetical protein
MKLFKKLMFAGLALVSINATAQTADEIIAKYVDSMGGAAKFTNLKTVKMSGNMSSNGADFPITMTKTHNVGFRIDFEVMGTSNYQLVAATKASAFMPVMGMTEPKELDADKYNLVAHQIDIQNGLYNYKEKGTKVELLAPEKIDGNEAYKLKVTYKLGAVVDFLLDKKTFKILKTVDHGSGPGGGDMESSYSDYKKNADGYWFPYAMTTINGPIKFDTIETNIKVDENIYKD